MKVLEYWPESAVIQGLGRTFSQHRILNPSNESRGWGELISQVMLTSLEKVTDKGKQSRCARVSRAENIAEGDTV